MMRHSYISSIDFTRATPGQLFNAAKHMHHSIGQQQLYRRRVDPEPAPEVILSQSTKKKEPERTFKAQQYIDLAF